MTAQPDLPHKVSQIRHDLDDLYEIVSQVQESQKHMAGTLDRHGIRLDELQHTLGQHGDRLDGLQQTLELHGGRLDGLDGRLDGLDGRLDGLQQTLELHGGRLDRIEDNQRRQFEHLSGQIAEVLGVLRGPVATDPAPDSEQ